VALDLWDVLQEADGGHAHPLLLASKWPLERLLEGSVAIGALRGETLVPRAP
jgi:hypothetical protein